MVVVAPTEYQWPFYWYHSNCHLFTAWQHIHTDMGVMGIGKMGRGELGRSGMGRGEMCRGGIGRGELGWGGMGMGEVGRG